MQLNFWRTNNQYCLTKQNIGKRNILTKSKKIQHLKCTKVILPLVVQKRGVMKNSIYLVVCGREFEYRKQKLSLSF